MSNVLNVQKSISFIEEHLTDPIKCEDVASQAYLSHYHFHRIFLSLTRETIHSYIRKRRLTEAAKQLLNTNDRILDLALDFQFESQSSFTRAFKIYFGIAPGRYRQNGKHLYARYKPMLDFASLQHLIGGISMEPKIIRKPAFKVIGMLYRGTNQNDEIARMWLKFNPRCKELFKVAKLGYTLGLCYPADNTSEENQFEYLACKEVNSTDEIPEGMESRSVDAQTYAVFTHRGPTSKLGVTYDYIYGTWLPKSEYEAVKAPDFEYYDERFTTVDDPDSQMDIYVPVKKK